MNYNIFISVLPLCNLAMVEESENSNIETRTRVQEKVKIA